MIESRKKIIDDILNGSPSRFRESYFIKNYPDILSDILDFCLLIKDISFNQKIWHILLLTNPILFNIMDFKTSFLLIQSSSQI